MNKLFLILSAIGFFVLLGFFVFAQTPVANSLLVVGANYCAESDNGLDYLNFGGIQGSFYWLPSNGTVNATFNGTFVDTCVSNTTLAEVVCGQSIDPSFTGLAGAVLVDCNIPNSTYGCRNGACVFVGLNGTNSTTNGTTTNSTNTTISLQPNLVIQTITWNYTSNGSIVSNSTNVTIYNFVANVFVRNLGNAAAGPSTIRVGFRMMTGPFASSYLYQNIPTQSLAPGQIALASKTFVGYSGQFKVNATADYLKVVNESNELDNQMIIANTLP